MPSAAFILLAILTVLLWVAGGASHAWVAGQAVVRAASIAVLIVAILFLPRPSLGAARPVAIALSAAVVLVLLQMLPLPPAWWQSLPGRSFATDAAALSGQAQPWRPWTLVPGATFNAAASLIVPVAVLALTATLRSDERRMLPGLLVAVTAGATLIGLLQFSGADLTNPLVNGSPGAVDGLFANRNHFALFLAIGIVMTPVWAFRRSAKGRWRGPAGMALIALFMLGILACGSRAGILLAGIAGLFAIIIGRAGAMRLLADTPRWVPLAIAGAGVAALALLASTAIMTGRAESINRALTMDIAQDMRQQARPTVVAMATQYWPAGSGFGSFDAVFRKHEPFELLDHTYFNHAHNDFLEIALDGGVAGVGLLLAVLSWWAWASFRAWRPGKPGGQSGDESGVAAARAGSAVILLVLLASVVDYPARTPVIMAVLVVAGVMLAGGAQTRPSALPATAR